MYLSSPLFPVLTCGVLPHLVNPPPSPEIAPGDRAFSTHKENGTALIFSLCAGLTFIEAICVHFVVRRYSAIAAWCIVAVSVYSAFWLISLARSFALRPMLVRNDSILIRAGKLWTLNVKRNNIARIDSIAVEPSKRVPGYLRVTGMGDPNVILELRERAAAQGLYGHRKTLSHVLISADQPREFLQAVRAMLERGPRQ